ncbi:MAG: arylsulfatase A [Cyclobacteriaceae bacterium]
MERVSYILRVQLIFASIVFLIAGCNQSSDPKPQKPNIIYILADDMGYGDLGCYGQKYIETPNIDQMAQKGVKFNYHFSGSTVCAPSRSSLLTGLHTGHAPVRGNKEFFPEGQQALPDTLMTTAKFLKQNGYVTAAMGKWGLGFIGTSGDPLNQGFDDFYGFNCQREAHSYYPDHLWKNYDKVELPGNLQGGMSTYAQDLIQDEALSFIKKNRENPFYLYLPYVAPHAELIAPDDSILSYYQQKFKDIKGKPYVASKGGDYGPDMVVGKYASQDEPRAHFAAMVSRLDGYVGEIVKLLEEEGIAENTLIIFTSDNGPHEEAGADPDFFNSNAGLIGHKRDLHEGGVRVPFIAYMPKVITAGSISNQVSAFWDMNKTYGDIIGAEYSADTDGISLWNSMQGLEPKVRHEFLYWEFHEKGGRQSIRKGDYKLVKLNVRKPEKTTLELYNLKKDPSERKNIAPSNVELVYRLTTEMEAQHTFNPIFPFYPDEVKIDNKPFYVE